MTVQGTSISHPLIRRLMMIVTLRLWMQMRISVRRKRGKVKLKLRYCSAGILRLMILLCVSLYLFSSPMPMHYVACVDWKLPRKEFTGWNPSWVLVYILVGDFTFHLELWVGSCTSTYISESCIGSMYVIQTLGPKALLFSVSSVIFCYYSTDCLVITKQRLLHFVLSWCTVIVIDWSLSPLYDYRRKLRFLHWRWQQPRLRCLSLPLVVLLLPRRQRISLRLLARKLWINCPASPCRLTLLLWVLISQQLRIENKYQLLQNYEILLY